jgi:hypothetical protein
MRSLIQRQRSLFIESTLPRAGDGDGGEGESEGDHEVENDEIEDESKRQCRKKLSRYTKTDDAKSENALKRLHFMKLKVEKDFFREGKFFFFFFEMRTR